MVRAKAGSPELNLDLPGGLQKPGYWRLPLVLPPRVQVYGKLEVEVEPGLRPRHSIMGFRYPKQSLNFGFAKCPPFILSLFKKCLLFI